VKESQVTKLLILNGFISLIPILILFIFGDWILNVFLGKDFTEVNTYLIVFTIGVMFIGLSNAISKGYLLPHGYDSLYRDISLRVSIISAVICIAGIYLWGLLGGALAITIARFLFFVDYLICYKKLS
jgi:O-antigen/teichoic acid export membrane protein